MSASRGQGAGGNFPGEMTFQLGVQVPAAVVQVRGRKISHKEDLLEQTTENELENNLHILRREWHTAPQTYDVKCKVGNRGKECGETVGVRAEPAFSEQRAYGLSHRLVVLKH